MTEPSPEAQARLEASEQMIRAIRSTPEQLRKGLALGAQVGRELNGQGAQPNRVIICGVGGSAFPAELLRLMLIQRGVACMISRSYLLPEPLTALSSEVLIVACSFSGNTEETLSSYHCALRTDALTVAISAGGELEKRAQSECRPHVRLERPSPGFQPRAATGLFLGALVGLLEELGLCAGGTEELKASASALEAHLMDATLNAQASELTEQIAGKIPVFYALSPYGPALAQLAKIKLNENAKQPAFWAELPEANHNELIGYTQLNSALIAVIFTDQRAPARMQTRVQETIKVLRTLGVSVTTLTLPEAPEWVARVLGALYLIDLASCSLAVRTSINPNEVELLERFKKRLGPFRGLESP